MFGEVLMASRFLPRDTILTAADLRAERRDLTTLPGEFETVPARLLGKQLRRSLSIGALIPPRAVATPQLIKRGERVTVSVRQTGMEISSSGIALSDAALGERLRVRNEASQRMIEGTVIAAHQIAVEP
jgi:flagella basal body P-ring formation protein FlgA